MLNISRRGAEGYLRLVSFPWKRESMLNISRRGEEGYYPENQLNILCVLAGNNAKEKEQ
jgi:hypothetical protein